MAVPTSLVPTVEDFTREGVDRWIVQLGDAAPGVYCLVSVLGEPAVTLSPEQALSAAEWRALRNSQTMATVTGSVGSTTVEVRDKFATRWVRPSDLVRPYFLHADSADSPSEEAGPATTYTAWIQTVDDEPGSETGFLIQEFNQDGYTGNDYYAGDGLLYDDDGDNTDELTAALEAAGWRTVGRWVRSGSQYAMDVERLPGEENEMTVQPRNLVTEKTPEGMPVGALTGIVHLLWFANNDGSYGLCDRELRGYVFERPGTRPTCQKCIDEHDMVAATRAKFGHPVCAYPVAVGSSRYGAEVVCSECPDRDGNPGKVIWKTNESGQRRAAEEAARQHYLTAYREHLAQNGA